MIGAVIAVLTVATVASGDVRLKVQKDGKKIIYNVGSSGSGKGTDYNWLAKRHDRRSKYDAIIERYAKK